jgi:hypothetical protein
MLAMNMILRMRRMRYPLRSGYLLLFLSESASVIHSPALIA